MQASERLRILTSENLRRLQEIFDQTCDEFGISRDLPCGRASREFLAKLLLRMGDDSETDPISAHAQLLARGRSYDLDRRVRRADGRH